MQDCFDEVTDEMEAIFPGPIIKKRGYTIKWVELPQKTCYNIQDKYETVLYG